MLNHRLTFILALTFMLSAFLFIVVTRNNDTTISSTDRQIAVPDGYEMVWNDEFNGNSLDTKKWNYDRGTGAQYGLKGWGNNELQYYTVDRPKNVRVENGMLILEAHREDYKNMEYTSGRIKTAGKGDWKYGRFEIKARLPEGRGTWPALWMLPTMENMRWPEHGEIDIMEHVGYDQNNIVATIHTGAYNHMDGTHIGDSIRIENAAGDFHRYALEWTPEKLIWFVDDRKIHEFTNPHKTHAEWPFDKPFHLIMNIAVGGNWGGKKGVDKNIWPQQMNIDYVRVFKKLENE